MKSKTILAAVLLISMTAFTAHSQTVKIGYTNIELVLAYMPEAKQLEQTLATYQKKLAEQLKVKEDYAQAKLQEYMEKKEKNMLSPEEASAKEKELMGLDDEIKKFAQEAEYNLLAKREELLTPILEKLQGKIDKVAKENGFTYILNQTTSGGVSTILYGPDENDITEKLMTELGIQIPQNNN